MLTSNLLSCAIQLAAVMLIAGVVYLVFGRKRQPSFAAYLGLTGCPPWVLLVAAVLGCATSYALLQWPAAHAAAKAPGTVIATVIKDGLSSEAALVLVVLALFKTSLSEEIFFRGLIGKRLINGLGFTFGNLLQAALFGGIHIALALLPGVETTTALVFAGGAFVMGWLSGWVNETYGKGSILPGWALHGAANLVSYIGLAYGLV